MANQITCTKCGAIAPTNLAECPNCGTKLNGLDALARTVLVPQDEEELITHLHNRRAYFGRVMQLVLYVLETDARIVCDLEHYLTLGREPGDTPENHLDLSDHNASQLGVSRRHARFIRSSVTVMIEDLGTLNGTFINGEKLAPGHTHVVCDGDELRLGAMIMAIIFEKKTA